MNTDPNRILPMVSITEKRFTEIARIVDRAAAGDPAAEAKLGAMDDREFQHWIGLRRARRLHGEVAQPRQAPVPRFPARFAEPGAVATEVGAVGGDPPPTNQVRGIARIAAALAAASAG